jgi:hypothetical protein
VATFILSLKPQDLCILLKIVVLYGAPWSYNQLAFELGMSASEVHAGVKRAANAGLMRLTEGWGSPDVAALEEFLVHGVKYAFAPSRGGLTLGIPTSHAAPPLDRLARPSEEPAPVWPHAAGWVQGRELKPLYKSVPLAARRDARLYELLALVDALRSEVGHVRDTAVRELHARLRTRRPGAKIISLTQTRLAQPAALRAAAAPTGQGSNGEEAKRIYRRRHRDS